MTDKEYLEKMVAYGQERLDSGEWTSGISISLDQAKSFLEHMERLEEIADLTKYGTRHLQDHNGEWYIVVTVEDLKEELGLSE